MQLLTTCATGSPAHVQRAVCLPIMVCLIVMCMKEVGPHGSQEDPLAAAAGQFVYRYEDGYDAAILPTFESLSEQFEEYAEGPFAAYNVPVWIEYDEEAEIPAVSIGVMLTRHGVCTIWRSPATPEQLREVQIRVMGVWANRADAAFGRFLRPNGQS